MQFWEGKRKSQQDFCSMPTQGKMPEAKQVVYMMFIDLTKALNTISKEGLWKILVKFSCPDKFITMVRQFHAGMTA